jgi:hypothetical protein
MVEKLLQKGDRHLEDSEPVPFLKLPVSDQGPREQAHGKKAALDGDACRNLKSAGQAA